MTRFRDGRAVLIVEGLIVELERAALRVAISLPDDERQERKHDHQDYRPQRRVVGAKVLKRCLGGIEFVWKTWLVESSGRLMHGLGMVP